MRGVGGHGARGASARGVGGHVSTVTVNTAAKEISCFKMKTVMLRCATVPRQCLPSVLGYLLPCATLCCKSSP